MKELILGDKTYFVVDDSLPSWCFRVLGNTETDRFVQEAKYIMRQEPEIVPKGLWHPVIQHFILTHKVVPC